MARRAPEPIRSPEPTLHALPLGPRVEAVLEVAHRARRPVLLEGPTGIGKSELVRGLATRLGIQHRVLDLSLLEPPDLVGLPVLEGGRTSFAAPRILPTEGEGILLLEELNRAERYIQQPALQLLSARRLHEYVLPAGWSVFAAINPETGDYQVTPLDLALRARFLQVPVRADRASWLAWAGAHGVHPAVFRDGAGARTSLRRGLAARVDVRVGGVVGDGRRRAARRDARARRARRVSAGGVGRGVVGRRLALGAALRARRARAVARVSTRRDVRAAGA
ncbi:MAG: AAA family ATPase [Sandaracinus sp.]|nr:AAA family ATPase [Sandaracinus sp.]